MDLKALRKLSESHYATSPATQPYSTSAACELVSYCFAARTAMHFAHLRSTNYAEHVALGDFYDEIASLADGFIECYMGITGRMASYPAIQADPNASPTAFLCDLREWVCDNRSTAAEGNTELENMIDEILSLIDKTCYKLKFLS